MLGGGGVIAAGGQYHYPGWHGNARPKTENWNTFSEQLGPFMQGTGTG